VVKTEGTAAFFPRARLARPCACNGTIPNPSAVVAFSWPLQPRRRLNGPPTSRAARGEGGGRASPPFSPSMQGGRGRFVPLGTFSSARPFRQRRGKGPSDPVVLRPDLRVARPGAQLCGGARLRQLRKTAARRARASDTSGGLGRCWAFGSGGRCLPASRPDASGAGARWGAADVSAGGGWRLPAATVAGSSVGGAWPHALWPTTAGAGSPTPSSFVCCRGATMVVGSGGCPVFVLALWWCLGCAGPPGGSGVEEVGSREQPCARAGDRHGAIGRKPSQMLVA
jgi:hypothetical protein